ncbi:hypothetical protein B0J12DRAFT_703630 [Macrophomina phaseolina]|uniref:Uncharacterized protein n=1 Tax=Macrophomina phaseolina TaxID=35725 RepID=A0ABQ8FY01_9PEZI|nr:hypothetical protein B0J12DRAFT_703630 [Macrophomina phaseolina]
MHINANVFSTGHIVVMNQQPAQLPQSHEASALPPLDCGTNPALHDPLPWPPVSFAAKSFTCITPPYGTRAVPNFAQCCDSPVANFTTVHLTSEGPSSCAAYCSVKAHRLLADGSSSSEFHRCLFGGADADKKTQLQCWDGELVVGGSELQDRSLRKRNAQENTDAPESTTTYDPSFWSSLISAAGTSELSISLPTEPMTPVISTTAANGTAASTSDASLATGSFVSISEISGTRTSTGASTSRPTGTSASATSAASSGSSTTSSGPAAATSATSGVGAQLKSGYGKWMCTALVISAVFTSL